MLRLADPTLVVLVGPSAAGKTTWAEAHFAPQQVVSSDRLRAVVGEGEHDLTSSADAFAVLELIVTARIGRRLTTVIDTLGLDDDRRARWVRLAASRGIDCVAVVFDTLPAACRRRNAARAHRVPARVLSGQLAEYARVRPLLATEGFARVLEPEPVRLVAPSVAAAAASSASSGSSGSSGSSASSGSAAASSGVAAIDRGEAAPVPGQPQGPGPGPERPRLRFGLQLSDFAVPGGSAALPAALRDVAARAEAAGFDSLWVMDHWRQIPQLGRPWDDLLESVTALGYLAAATSRVRIGALVHCITFRNLGQLAKVVSTLDVLSGGRAVCGLGAGWFEAEHAAYGLRFPPAAERLDLLEDALQALPLLWGPGAPPFAGRRVTLPETLCYPRPVQARVPILVGGSGERRTLRLVARYADACNLTGDVELIRRKVAVLQQYCAEFGRNPLDVEVTHLSTALVCADEAELDAEVTRRRPARGGPRWTAWTNPGTVADHVLRVEALRDVGIQHVIVSLAGVWDSAAVERFGDVIAAFRPAASV